MPFFYEHGLCDIFYWGCYVIGFIVMFAFNAKYAVNYSIPKKKALFFSIVSYILIYALAYLLGWVANGFKWGHHNAIRVFVWMPVVLLLTGKIFKIKWRTACDYIAPSTCLVYGIARLGCNFAGCCYGYRAKWGIMSWQAGYHCIPVQLFQSIASFAIFYILIRMAKKQAFKITNKLYPRMLVMYGGARFLLDFMVDNEKLFLHISELALWGLLCVVVGTAWLLILKRKCTIGDGN